MDADSSTGLNSSSDSAQEPDDYRIHDYDSGSKQSAMSEQEPTNIDALDDTARDTLIAPLEDSRSCPSSVQSVKRLTTTTLSEGALHDELDFEGGDDDDVQPFLSSQVRRDEDDDDDDGEIEDDDEEEENGLSNAAPDAAQSPPPAPPRQRDDEEEGELEESEDSLEARNSGLEDGEVDEMPKKRTMIKIGKAKVPKEDLEEGEVSDDDDRNKDPKPVCRFFGKGQCTWGSNCRFLHPGVTDKGLYTMFDPMRPLPLPTPAMPHFPIKTGLLGHAPPNFAPIIKLEEPVIESAWERGLRHAKEIIKQSVKRKETDVDFEEKKMNLSLAQEEIDKENDYYSRKSPKERPALDADDDHFDDYNSPPVPIPSGPRDWPPPPSTSHPPAIDAEFVRDRVHHLKPGRVREAPPRDAPLREAPPLHDSEVRMVRESALRRNRFQDDFQGSSRGGRGFDDPRKAEDWHDPWSRGAPRKARKDSTMSKRSSYSSGSSRSSSRSSASSKSTRSTRSSSTSKSSKGSGPPGAHKRKSIKNDVVRKVAPPRRLSPKPVRIAPPPPPKEEFSRRPNYGGGPPHYDRERENRDRDRGDRPDRITRYAPPQQSQPQKNIGKDSFKDRMDKRNEDKGPPHRNPPPDRSGRPAKKMPKWSGSSRSRSRSRSRSFTPWSKSSKSRSRSRSIKRRSKFVRNRSNSAHLSRSPVGRKSWSRSRSGSSSSASSIEMKSNPKRKRPFTGKDTKAAELLGQPMEKIPKLDSEARTARTGKSDSHSGKTQTQGKQIKLTLKANSAPYKANKTVLDKLADDIDAEDSNSFKEESSPQQLDDLDDNSNASSKNQSGSPNESRQSKLRRDELLKQLKAVEDAIAKKRSKLV